MAETSIQAARRKAREKREAEEKKVADAKAAATAAAKKPATKPGLLDAIRKAFSSEDDIERIEAAVNAVDKGVSEADSKRKKK